MKTSSVSDVVSGSIGLPEQVDAVKPGHATDTSRSAGPVTNASARRDCSARIGSACFPASRTSHPGERSLSDIAVTKTRWLPEGRVSIDAQLNARWDAAIGLPTQLAWAVPRMCNARENAVAVRLAVSSNHASNAPRSAWVWPPQARGSGSMRCRSLVSSSSTTCCFSDDPQVKVKGASSEPADSAMVAPGTRVDSASIAVRPSHAKNDGASSQRARLFHIATVAIYLGLGAATSSCVPSATLDPCDRCPGACSEGLCQLAEVSGNVTNVVASESGVFFCSDNGDNAQIGRVTKEGDTSVTGTLVGKCNGVAVDGPFAYFGIGGSTGGIYRTDKTGQGLHLFLPLPSVSGVTVGNAVVSMTTSAHSTPLTLSPSGDVRPIDPFRQFDTHAGPAVTLENGMLLWGVAATREAFITAPDGSGPGAVYNGTWVVGSSPVPPFLLAADASAAFVVDGETLWELPIEAVRAPRQLATSLREPRAVAVRTSDVVVAEADRIRSFPRGVLALPSTLANIQVPCVSVFDDRIFVGRGSSVAELR